jgi:hypothetical protein
MFQGTPDLIIVSVLREILVKQQQQQQQFNLLTCKLNSTSAYN